MLKLQELHLLMQLVDNLNILKEKLKQAYANNDAENFEKAKKEILNIQKKIGEITNKE